MRARTNHDRAVCSLRRSHALLRRSLALIARLQLLLQLPHTSMPIRSFWTTCIALSPQEFLNYEALKTHSPKMVKEMEVLFPRMVKVWGLR